MFVQSGSVQTAMTDAPVDFFPSSYHETAEVGGGLSHSSSGLFGSAGLRNSMDPLNVSFDDEPPLLDGAFLCVAAFFVF